MMEDDDEPALYIIDYSHQKHFYAFEYILVYLKMLLPPPMRAYVNRVKVICAVTRSHVWSCQ